MEHYHQIISEEAITKIRSFFYKKLPDDFEPNLVCPDIAGRDIPTPALDFIMSLEVQRPNNV